MLYSLDLEIHRCSPDNKDKEHFGRTYTLWRHTFDECLSIIKDLWIKEYRFCRREKKPNIYWYTDRGMVDVCILIIYDYENATNSY